MTTHRWVLCGIAAAAVIAAYAANMVYGTSTAPTVTAEAPAASGYAPTPGFVYFPAQYQNQATKIEDHVENF